MSARKEKAESKKSSEVLSTPLPIEPEILDSHAATISHALENWRAGGRVPPVLLLVGPRGCGKREIAYHLAQTLQCENAGFAEKPDDLFGGSIPGPSAPGACGSCSSCLRAISGQPLDFREISLRGDARTLGVDQFREMKESMGFSGYAAGYRIFLISDADRMTLQAANSLLKILEEPPVGWVFLLTVADPSLLPSTVVSRCQILRMLPLARPNLEALLRKRDVAEDRIAVVATIGEGSLARALELAEEDAWEIRSEILQFLVAPETAFLSLIDYATRDVAKFRNLLDQFEPLLGDLVLRSGYRDAPLRNPDARKALDEHAQRCTKKLGSPERATAFWIERSERLFRLRREITVPLNQKVLAQDFLSPFMGAV